MTVQEWLGEKNQIGIDIWNRKYRYENETFNEWIDRVSGGNHAVAELIRQKKFLFGGRILANRGLDQHGVKVSYSNCYVITPPEDNIESIFECASKLARTFSYGGGCGIDISKLAPRGAKVANTAKETSGAVSFMDLYSMITGLIGQSGRRGALMISIDCHHPDIEEFLQVKSDLNRVTKANISIRLTDDFMQAVRDGEQFKLSFTRPESGEIIEKEIDARAFFDKLAEMNWDFAEPGCLFWDRIENWNLLSNTEDFHYASVNPCAEEALPAGGSCLLGSINLSEFVTPDKEFDYASFKQTVKTAVCALNDVLDEGLPLHPLQEQRDSVRDWRQIGLGIFGLADMLIKMDIAYGSEKSLDLCERIGYTMADTAMRQSARLAKEKGSFPKCNRFELTSTPYFNANCEEKTKALALEYGLRNSQILTIAPTGTLSTMLGVSGGIEPIFATSYDRKTESLHNEEVHYKVYTPIVEQYMKQHGLQDEAELPEWFVTAQTINYRDRIAMQAVWQNHIDASISSTVNVPNDFTVGQVFDLYFKAWEQGLKGITIFRDGCKRTGVLSTASDTTRGKNKPQTMETLERGAVISTADDLVGKKRKLTTGCGSLHCSAFFDPVTGDLMETYLSKGGTGGCALYMTGLSRMISLAARSGVNILDIVDQLLSCGACPSYAVRTAQQHDVSKGSCCPTAIGYALLDMYDEMKDETIATEPEDNAEDESDGDKNKIITNPCPVCGNELVFEGGCNTCKACGYSKCD